MIATSGWRRGRAKIHILHVTSAEGVDIIRRAKAKGVRVTARRRPTTGTLTDERWKVWHNARDESAAARGGGCRRDQGGHRDVPSIASPRPRAAHRRPRRKSSFQYAPFGILGWRRSLALTIHGSRRDGDRFAGEGIALMTSAPAGILGLEAGHAARAVPRISPCSIRGGMTVDPTAFLLSESEHALHRYEAARLVEATICDGKVVYSA